MSIETVLFVFFLLQIKHLIIDWCWQPEYEWKNKGTFLHWGGIRHAGKNAIGTSLCLMFFNVPGVIVLGLIDFIIHYLIDWSKMNINQHYSLDANKHPEFWWLTGLDQFLHQITYIGLIWLALKHIYI